MLKVIKHENIDGLRKKEFDLILNGESLPVSFVPKGAQVYEVEQGFHVDSYDLDINNKIKQLTAKDFPEIVELNLFWGKLDDFRLYIEIQFPKKGTAQSKNEELDELLVFEIYADLQNWKRKFSIIEYKARFYRNLQVFEKLGIYFIQSDKKPLENLSIKLSISHEFGNSPIFTEIKKYEDVLLQCLRQSTAELEREFDENSIVASFNFPDELKVQCEQYLLYFAQFLRDLGINAISNLKEEAGKVLFSITPTDDIEALDKIREALTIYLSLSSNPIPNSTGDRTVDMVLSGARANAKHLESQLELAVAKLQFKEATLELKDATIEQHQLTLRQKDETIKELQELISRGHIFEESLEKVEINGEVIEESSLYRFSRKDDIEVEATPILNENNEETRVGLVKFHEITKFKDYGATIDLPKAIRNLIDYFKRDKDS